MGATMIELLIISCLAAGECNENRITFDHRDVSLMTCMKMGQIEVARWQLAHPAWEVKRWSCRMANSYGRIIYKSRSDGLSGGSMT
jgi:hypothetical protein